VIPETVCEPSCVVLSHVQEARKGKPASNSPVVLSNAGRRARRGRRNALAARVERAIARERRSPGKTLHSRAELGWNLHSVAVSAGCCVRARLDH
jgi:hypothetical protein